MNNELYVVNEHGEVIDKIDSNDKYVKLSDGDRVLRNKSIQYLKDTIDIKYRFVKVNPYIYSDIANQYPIINTLIKYIGYMDGILSYRNGKNIKMKDIHKICNVSESTAKRQLKGLIQKDVIHKVKDKKAKQTYLILNPYVAYVGRKIYLSLFEEFKQSQIKDTIEECGK